MGLEAIKPCNIDASFDNLEFKYSPDSDALHVDFTILLNILSLSEVEEAKSILRKVRDQNQILSKVVV